MVNGGPVSRGRETPAATAPPLIPTCSLRRGPGCPGAETRGSHESGDESRQSCGTPVWRAHQRQMAAPPAGPWRVRRTLQPSPESSRGGDERWGEAVPRDHGGSQRSREE